MQYYGQPAISIWTGTIVAHPAVQGLVLHVEDRDGKPVPIMISVGKVVPENWIGKRVKVTAELIEEEPSA